MNIYLVALIFLAVLVVPNLLAYWVARGAKHTDSKFWAGFESTLRRPFRKEDQALDELHQRVRDLGHKDGP